MKVGLLTLELRLPGVGSLKEKRSIIRGLIATVERHGAAFGAAEVADLDARDRATIRIAHLSNDPQYTDAVLRQLQMTLEDGRGYLVEEAKLEIL